MERGSPARSNVPKQRQGQICVFAELNRISLIESGLVFNLDPAAGRRPALHQLRRPFAAQEEFRAEDAEEQAAQVRRMGDVAGDDARHAYDGEDDGHPEHGARAHLDGDDEEQQHLQTFCGKSRAESAEQTASTGRCAEEILLTIATAQEVQLQQGTRNAAEKIDDQEPLFAKEGFNDLTHHSDEQAVAHDVQQVCVQELEGQQLPPMSSLHPGQAQAPLHLKRLCVHVKDDLPGEHRDVQGKDLPSQCLIPLRARREVG